MVNSSPETMEVDKRQSSNIRIDPAQVTAQVDRILAHPSFADCVRSKQFMRYVVGKTLEGHAGRIKGAAIANDVFQLEDPEQVQTSTMVRVEAGRLRRRLELYYATDGETDPIHITIPKGSYVPNFELTHAQSEAQQAPAAQTPAQPLPLTRLLHLPPAFLVIAGLMLIAGAMLWVLIPDRSASQKPVAVTPLWDKPSIAVLPFENFTNDPDDAGMTAGLTEDIITDLSRLSGIDVIALTSVLPYQERKASPQLIHTELGTSHVLYGSVRGTSGKLRVTVQLYHAPTGRQIWAERFDRELTNMLSLQDELATRIVESMATGFDTPDRSNSDARQNLESEAYSLYKQALGMVNPPNDFGRLISARQAFQQVIQMAPNYAGGYAGAAYTHAFVAFWGRSKTPEKEIRLAWELLDKAIELDASFGLAFSTQAVLFMAQRDFEHALTASNAALRAQPNDPYVAIYHAAVLLSSGKALAGIEYARRALRLDPLSPRTPYLNILGIAYFHAGEYQQALNAMQRNIDRGGPFGAHIQAYVTAAHAQLGDIPSARKHLLALDMYPDDFSWEDWLRRWHKDPREAERILTPIRDLAQNENARGYDSK